MVVLLFSILEAGISAFGNEAIVDHHKWHVEAASALCEVDFAVHAYELVCFIVVAVADYEHLAEVYLLTALTQYLVFKKRNS